MRTAHTIIMRPLITEKTMSLAGQGWFSFEVTMSAAKDQIKTEIERLYKVNVIGVRTIHIKGKVRRVGKKSREVTRSDRKKAMVHLKKGQSISVFEVTQEGATA